MTHVSTIYGPSGQKGTVFLAKLEGVMALVDAISYKGVQYDRTSGEAAVGDVIRFDDHSSYVTTGGFYEVVRINEADDPQIIDDDGHEFDLCSREYTVFKRAKASVSDVVTHGGVQYRKTTREPQEGDKVVGSNNRVYTLGKRASDYDGSYGTAFWLRDTDEWTWLGKAQFTVLERIETPLRLPSDYIVHSGEVYRKENRQADAGELIYVVDAKPHGKDTYKNGDVLTVTRQFGSRTEGVRTYGTDNGLFRSEYVTLAPVTSIDIAGTTYNVAKRRANVGETILVVKASITSGAYDNGDVLTVKTSKVAGVGNSEHVKADADKREATLWTKEYVVLTPQSVKKSESSQTSNTQYREVKRVAKAGERIRIVNASDTMGKYANGDELVVKRSPHLVFSASNGGKGFGVEVDKFELIVLHSEYVVLEPIETPKIDEATARRRAVKVGDRVRVTVDCGGHPVGTIGTVTEVMSVNFAQKDNSVRVEANGRTWAECNVEPVDETPVCTPSRDTAPATSKQRYNVGDYVKVVAHGGGHDYNIGDIVKVLDGGSMFSGVVVSSGRRGNCLIGKNVVPATDAEIDAAKRSAFAKGDTVRLVSGGGVFPLHGFYNGQTYTVDNNDYPHAGAITLVKIVRTDGKRGFATPDQIVKLTSETAVTPTAPCCAPSRQATVETPKRRDVQVGDYARTLVEKDVPKGSLVKIAEDDGVDPPLKGVLPDGSDFDWYRQDQLEYVDYADACWELIGRNKDEYRVGDVVAITRDQCGDPVGSVVEIVRVRPVGNIVDYTSRKATTGKYGASVDAITLVVPVEQRFDKRV